METITSDFEMVETQKKIKQSTDTKSFMWIVQKIQFRWIIKGGPHKLALTSTHLHMSLSSTPLNWEASHNA